MSKFLDIFFFFFNCSCVAKDRHYGLDCYKLSSNSFLGMLLFVRTIKRRIFLLLSCIDEIFRLMLVFVFEIREIKCYHGWNWLLGYLNLHASSDWLNYPYRRTLMIIWTYNNIIPPVHLVGGTKIVILIQNFESSVNVRLQLTIFAKLSSFNALHSNAGFPIIRSYISLLRGWMLQIIDGFLLFEAVATIPRVLYCTF